MSNGKVITIYLLYVIILSLVPGMLGHHWIWFASGALVGIVWWIIAATAGDKILLKTLGAESLNVARYNEIAKLVASRGIGANMSPPSLWMIRHMSPMVLAIGLSPKSSHLVFTQGFFDRMDDKAQMGLVVRQIEEIREGVTAANTGLATILWILLLPGRLVSQMAGKQPGEPNILSTIFNLVPAFMLCYPMSLIGSDKKKVYLIDSAAMRKLTQDNPDYVPYGLMKLQESVLTAPFDCDLAASGLCIINPNNRDPFQGLFKLHPPTPKRIDRLRMRADSSRRKLKK